MGKSTTDELVEAITPKTKKLKQKKGTDMKRTILTIVATVVLTLAVVLAFVLTYKAGVTSERTRQNEISRLVNQVKSELTLKK